MFEPECRRDGAVYPVDVRVTSLRDASGALVVPQERVHVAGGIIGRAHVECLRELRGDRVIGEAILGELEQLLGRLSAPAGAATPTSSRAASSPATTARRASTVPSVPLVGPWRATWG